MSATGQRLQEAPSPPQIRTRLRDDPAYRLVDPQQFCTLAVSRRVLRRKDEVGGMLRGLHDEQEGVTFVVEDERLRRHFQQQSR